jgi:exodeoxyribonuclease V alpha subunit
MAELTALRASGLLGTFSENGVLSVADVQVASRLGALTGEHDERVLLALALVVRGTRQGSVMLDLADVPATVTAESEPDGGEPVPLTWPDHDDWLAACARSPLVERRAGGQPVHLVGSRLWLDRYWQQEAAVGADLARRAAQPPQALDEAVLSAALDELYGADNADDGDQRRAVELAARARVSVIAGGPGTGKTTTIARLIAVLARQRSDLRVALAAPTGKAAARLGEAVHEAAEPLTAADRAVLAGLAATTLHRLLGWRPGATTRFRHDHDNRLPYDVVVVDESSMVGLTLMARLLDAMAPEAQLVLVGDPGQLASVEAGAVLGDLVDSPRLRESVATLTTVYRFRAGGTIAQLAQCVRDGRADDAIELLDSAPDELVFHRTDDAEPVTGAALDAVHRQAAREQAMIAHARAGEVEAALDALDAHRLLCAHRLGPRGVRRWSTAIERWLLADDPTLTPRLDGHYAGQALMVTANDYENGLFNGDTGVVIARGDDLVVAFRGSGPSDPIPLVRLGAVTPVHAMTVHRAQGSQFDEVTVLLPFVTSQLATRQTFYTAVTRARSRVHLVGSEAAVRACISRTAARATGLPDRLSGRL